MRRCERAVPWYSLSIGYLVNSGHMQKKIFWGLLEPREAGSWVMLPVASVSGWYLSYPESCYPGVGRLDRDQVDEYASWKGIALEVAEQYLIPNLAY